MYSVQSFPNPDVPCHFCNRQCEPGQITLLSRDFRKICQIHRECFLSWTLTTCPQPLCGKNITHVNNTPGAEYREELIREMNKSCDCRKKFDVVCAVGFIISFAAMLYSIPQPK